MSQSDVVFRTQLILPNQTLVFDHWRDIRGDRLWALKTDLNLRRIKPCLGWISVLSIEPTGPGTDESALTARLVGVKLCNLFQCDPTGSVLSPTGDAARAALERGGRNALIRQAPTAGVARFRRPGLEPMMQFWLRLPMALSVGDVRPTLVLAYDQYFTLGGLPVSVRERLETA